MFRPLLIASLLVAALPALADDFFADQYIGTVTVEGNTSTRTSLILAEFGIRTGDPLDYDAVDAAWERLEDLGWFAFVDISMDDSLDEVPVTILVEEDRTTRGYPIIDYDPRWDILLGVRIYDINLGGRGERLSVSGIWHEPHRYEASWEHPWLFGVKGLALSLDGRWEDAPFVFRDFDYRAWEAGLGLRWDFAEPLFVAGRVARTTFEQEGGMTSAVASWNAAEREGWSVGGTLGLDSRDIATYPTRGAHHRISATRHDGDGFDAFTELTVDLRQYVPTPWGHVLALHALAREVDAHVPPEHMLFWGGAETIRGYHYGEIEGEEGWLLSGEYRWPLFLVPISADGRVISGGLHAFGDAGEIAFHEGTAGVRHSYGAGLHLGLSSHVFRFEVARTRDGRTAFQFMDHFNF